MKQTKLEMEKPYWCIVKSGDVKGYYTGKADVQVNLFEFDTVTEMQDFLGDGSVEAGESMGDYMFKQLAISHSWQELNAFVEEEKEVKLQEEGDAEYYEMAYGVQ